jgi:hypothetical protein
MKTDGLCFRANQAGMNPQRKFRVHLILFLVLLLFVKAGWIRADILVFNSAGQSNNAAQLDAWLSAIGISEEEVEFLVDFETGFVAGQNVSGVAELFPGGLVISDTSSSGLALIQSSSGYFGGSNPVGQFAVAQNEKPYLELDFTTRPVDYVSFQDIDHTGTDVFVDFVDANSVSFHLETTAYSGDTAEFAGIFRNDMPRIMKIRLDSSGDNEWGVDNIRYGVLSCVVDLNSFALFAQQWLMAGESHAADLDDSGGVDVLDLDLFVDYWLDACPADWPL